jgi:hypothetical protein
MTTTMRAPCFGPGLGLGREPLSASQRGAHPAPHAPVVLESGTARRASLAGRSQSRRRQLPFLALVIVCSKVTIRFGNTLDAGKMSNEALAS